MDHILTYPSIVVPLVLLFERANLVGAPYGAGGRRTSGSRYEARAIWGDVTAVYFEIFKIAYRKSEMLARADVHHWGVVAMRLVNFMCSNVHTRMGQPERFHEMHGRCSYLAV